MNMKEYDLTLMIRGKEYEVSVKAKDYFDALIKGRNAGMQIKASPRDVAVVEVLDDRGISLM